MLLATLAGQALWGVAGYNAEARTAGLQQVSFWRYVTSSGFAVDVAENWQSEFLQFVLFIALTVCSCSAGRRSRRSPATRAARATSSRWSVSSPSPTRRPGRGVGGWRTRLYSHSLVLVMAVVFLGSWSAQAVAGRVADNEERMRDLLDPIGLGAYLVSPDFWGRTLQNWQSELLAIGTMAVFAIYLRERGSPESKEVGAPHAVTRSSD